MAEGAGTSQLGVFFRAPGPPLGGKCSEQLASSVPLSKRHMALEALSRPLPGSRGQHRGHLGTKGSNHLTL